VSEPFVGQIMTVGFTFAPDGWAFCNGQILPISQNTALFSLLGTQYGGDGQSTFALPNLEGRVPLGFGQGPGLTDYGVGELGGSTTVTLFESEIPSHTHIVSPVASDNERTTDHPANAYPTTGGIYASSPDSSAPMGSTASSTVGGSPHNNLQPYLVLNFVIALQGIFPARS
jgi:microcystin-dependent protein